MKHQKKIKSKKIETKEKKKNKLVSKKDKKHFLSMDLTERIIRVEQKISSKFDKEESKPDYNETEYYKSLTKSQKKDFDKHLKKKKHKNIFVKLLIILPLVVLGILKISITGRVIENQIGSSSFNLLGIMMFFILAVGGFITLINVLSNRVNEQRYSEYFEILEDSYKDK